MAVEPPLRVEHCEELVWLLAQACELEHGLMCEYLFAQFTLKRTQQEGLSVQQLAKVARGVPEVGRLSCCTFVFVDEAAEDVTAVELPRCG